LQQRTLQRQTLHIQQASGIQPVHQPHEALQLEVELQQLTHSQRVLLKILGQCCRSPEQSLLCGIWQNGDGHVVPVLFSPELQHRSHQIVERRLQGRWRNRTGLLQLAQTQCV